MSESQSSFRVTVTQLTEARELVHRAKCLLLDWDGCVAIANRPRPAALAFIARNVHRCAIVSNNSTHLPGDIADILEADGVAFPSSRIFLAGAEAVARAVPARVPTMVVGNPRLKARGRELGLTMSDSDVGQVVLLRDTKFTYARLQRAVTALRAGARLIVANPDQTHPGPDGGIVPETGALLAAIEACLDTADLDMEIVGKPAPHLFSRACASLDTRPEHAVMIGDNPLTDAAGAGALDMPSILVEPGSALSFDDLARESLGARPATGMDLRAYL
ncbi:MAG: HAD hydrolase-like protein [Rhodospirillaceae bacterium]|nr:HAD hydrolase-like protein [Rhodospirillaceae bacterium]